MFYIAYLDEFGHEGPFISRSDPRHKTSPVFGLGGFVLPADKIRSFATWFFQLKCKLLQYEIDQAGVAPYQWEKKGASLFTTKNVLKYRSLRQAAFSILNRIESDGGQVIYVGMKKSHPPETHSSKSIYKATLGEVIKRLDQFCEVNDSSFLMVLDEREGGDFRSQIVAEASKQMYGQPRRRMIEPPIQAESHLFQTLQCADWLCGLIGRVGCYKADPVQYSDFNWTEKYFSHRLARVAPRSGIRMERPAGLAAQAPDDNPTCGED